MKPTTSTLVATLCLAAACAPAESSEDDSGSGGTDSDTTGSSDAQPPSETDSTGTESSSEECDFLELNMLLDCPDDAPMLGVPGASSVDFFEYEWEFFNAECESSQTAAQYFTLPDDIISFSLVVTSDTQPVVLAGAANDSVLLIDLQEMGETSLGEPPLKHLQGPTANLTLPLSPDTVPAPGCLAILPITPGDATGGGGIVYIATRRGDPLDAMGRLSINAIRVGDVQISQEEIEAALIGMDNLYTSNGAGTLAEISYIDLPSDTGSFIPTKGPEIEQLRSSEIGGPSSAINVFFIDDFTDAPGVLGTAAGIPGPNGVPETPGSGVVIALAAHRAADGFLNTTVMGETIAHEVGHQLGLFHTSESAGDGHDLAPDTDECTLDMDTNGDGKLAAEECPDGQNVMFWTSASFPQDLMSPAQSDVLFYSPVSE